MSTASSLGRRAAWDACSETTVTADGRAAAVGGGTVRERDWLFDGDARIGEALDD